MHAVSCFFPNTFFNWKNTREKDFRSLLSKNASSTSVLLCQGDCTGV